MSRLAATLAIDSTTIMKELEEDAIDMWQQVKVAPVVLELGIMFQERPF